MNGLTDIHAHVVYGVDDGPRTLEESVALLEAACRDGIRRLIATSHAYPAMHAFPRERYFRHLREINYECREKRGMDIQLFSGCEIFYSDVAVEQLRQRKLPTLAGTACVLVEFDPTSSVQAVTDAVRRLANAGYLPVIAHCERYDAFRRNLGLFEALRSEFRVLFQMNAATVVEKAPWDLRRFREHVLSHGLIDLIATDAHNTSDRPPLLGEARELLAKQYGEEAARRWTGENQQAIFEMPLI